MDRPTVFAEKTVILASASKTRARVLANAGISFRAVPAPIDEEAVKRDLRSDGATAAEVAKALAREKAIAVARDEPGRIVIGADQVLELDGEAFDKPSTIDEAAMQLRRLSGRTHGQIACVCAVRDDKTLWTHQGRATLHVRNLSETFITAYIEKVGAAVLEGPGAYRLEGLGAQIFVRVDGDFFTVLGLPLLPLLAFLREEGVLVS